MFFFVLFDTFFLSARTSSTTRCGTKLGNILFAYSLFYNGIGSKIIMSKNALLCRDLGGSRLTIGLYGCIPLLPMYPYSVFFWISINYSVGRRNKLCNFNRSIGSRNVRTLFTKHKLWFYGSVVSSNKYISKIYNFLRLRFRLN